MARARVELQAPPDFRTVACLWCDWREEGDSVSLRLLHDYEDLKPAAGWRAVKDGRAWEATGREGRELRLAPLAEE